jgi:hypothetical protein
MKTQTLTLVILLLGVTGIARADHDDGRRSEHESHERFHVSRGSPSIQAPEIDPASMVAALTLLGGALAVLRGRRSIKPSR